MTEIVNAKHEQILDTAEGLFSTRGYNAVRLRDIADAVDIKHAALYYYAPGGKEQLFVDVMTRSFARHHAGMMAAVADAAPDLRAQLVAVAAWLLAHAPLNIAHMEQADFAAISPENAERLTNMIFDALRLPLRSALAAAQGQGDIAIDDVDLAALSFIVLVESVHNATNPFLVARKEETVEAIIDMLMLGWLPRP